MDYKNISILKGQRLKNIQVIKDIINGDSIVFFTQEGKRYKMYHSQDCCENVSIEDINGELGNLIGAPLTICEESSSSKGDDGSPEIGEDVDSCTWTFYRFGTYRGFVTIRWYGESNGYYSESVDFIEMD